MWSRFPQHRQYPSHRMMTPALSPICRAAPKNAHPHPQGGPAPNTHKETGKPPRQTPPGGPQGPHSPHLQEEGEQQSYLMPTLEGSDSASVGQLPGGHLSAHEGIIGLSQTNIHGDKGSLAIHAAPQLLGTHTTLYRNMGGTGIRMDGPSTGNIVPAHHLEIDNFYSQHLIGGGPGLQGEGPIKDHVAPSVAGFQHRSLLAYLPPPAKGAYPATSVHPAHLLLQFKQHRGWGWALDSDCQPFNLGIGGKWLSQSRQMIRQTKRYPYHLAQAYLRWYQQQQSTLPNRIRWWLGMHEPHPHAPKWLDTRQLTCWPHLQMGESLELGQEQVTGWGLITGWLGLRLGWLKLEQTHKTESFARGQDDDYTYSWKQQHQRFQRHWVDLLIAFDAGSSQGKETTFQRTQHFPIHALPSFAQRESHILQQQDNRATPYAQDEAMWVQMRHQWYRQGFHLLSLPPWSARLQLAALGAIQQQSLWRSTYQQGTEVQTTLIRQSMRSALQFSVGMHQWSLTTSCQVVAGANHIVPHPIVVQLTLRYPMLGQSQMQHGIEQLQRMDPNLSAHHQGPMPQGLLSSKGLNHTLPYQLHWQMELPPPAWSRLSQLHKAPWGAFLRQHGGDPWQLWRIFHHIQGWSTAQGPTRHQVVGVISKLAQHHPLLAWHLLQSSTPMPQQVVVHAPMYRQQIDQAQQILLPFLTQTHGPRPMARCKTDDLILRNIRVQLVQTERSLRRDQLLALGAPKEHQALLQAFIDQRKLAQRLQSMVFPQDSKSA